MADLSSFNININKRTQQYVPYEQLSPRQKITRLIRRHSWKDRSYNKHLIKLIIEFMDFTDEVILLDRKYLQAISWHDIGLERGSEITKFIHNFVRSNAKHPLDQIEELDQMDTMLLIAEKHYEVSK